MQYKSLTIALMIAVLSLGTGFAQSKQSGKSRSGGQSNRGASGTKRSGGNSASGARSRSQGNRSSSGKSIGNSRSQSFGNSRSNSAKGGNSGSRANNNTRGGQSKSSTRSLPNSSNFNFSNRSNNQRGGNIQDRGRSNSQVRGNQQNRGNTQTRGVTQDRGNTRGQGSFQRSGSDRKQGNSLDRSGTQNRGTFQGRGSNNGRGSSQVGGNNQTFGGTQNRGGNRGFGTLQGFGNDLDRGNMKGRGNDRDRDFDRNRGNNQNRANSQGRGNTLDRNFDRDRSFDRNRDFDRDRFDNRGRGNDRDGRNDSDRNRTGNRGRGYDNDRDRDRDYDRNRNRDRGRRPIVIDHDHRNRQHNRDRVNDWYRNGDWKRNVTINGRHWNGRPWWHTYDYNGWRHGHWHGYNYYRGRDYWRYNIGYQDYWLDGLVVWGLGNLAYRTGYQHYCNPFYSQPIIIGSASIDYGYPISVQPSQYETYYRGNETSVDPNETAALARFSEARQAFYNGDKATALNSINQAIALMPDDTTYHEFRALVLFSNGQYKEAAETIYAVLAVAPGWDWATMKTLYRENQLYIDELRALEAYVRGNEDAAGARFLLAYHYITIGYPEHASAKLREVIALKPDAQLAQDLLNLLDDDKPVEELPPPNQDPFAEMRTPVVAAEKLVGTWKAERVDGDIFVNFSDGSFSWDYKLLQNDSKFAGSYSIERDILMLATPEGSQLSGTITFSSPDKFNFKVLGAGENDPGIDFVKQ